MPPRAPTTTLVRLGQVLALWACAACLLPANAGAAAPARLTDAQLDRDVAALEVEAERIGEALLEADAQRSEISRNRDAALWMLEDFLAQSYKLERSGGGLVADVLSASSMRAAVDRLRIAAVVSEHHAGLIRQLDAADARLDVTEVRRAQAIVRLTAVQRELEVLGQEQLRREQRRQARRQAAAEAAERSRREEDAAGTLVSGGPGLAAMGAAPSASSIDVYLAAKGSPMAGQGSAFMASGMRWQVDPRLLVAIAGAESNFGQTLCGPHNAWGWACPNDPADFGTWAEGIDTVTRGLRRYYLDEGRTSVRLIQQKYCPVGAANDPTGLNSHWLGNVTRFLLEQGGNPMRVGPGPVGGPQLPDIGGLGLVARD